jgi:hypothetical protein
MEKRITNQEIGELPADIQMEFLCKQVATILLDHPTWIGNAVRMVVVEPMFALHDKNWRMESDLENILLNVDKERLAAKQLDELFKTDARYYR